jgi:hypothetical protein
MHSHSIKYIIAEGLDVDFYSFKERAGRYMEAIDVSDGVYKGYDAEGRLLRISPRKQASQIELAEDEPQHAQELAHLLVRFLTALGRIPTRRDLGSLLEMCAQYVR